MSCSKALRRSLRRIDGDQNVRRPAYKRIRFRWRDIVSRAWREIGGHGYLADEERHGVPSYLIPPGPQCGLDGRQGVLKDGDDLGTCGESAYQASQRCHSRYAGIAAGPR